METAVASRPCCCLNRAWLPSPDQSIRPSWSAGANSVMEYRSPAGLTRYNTLVAVSGVGSPAGGCSPGLCGVTGVQTASIHPGPTCDQGTSPMACSVPLATAGVAAGAAGLAELAADAAGLLELDCA